MDKIKGEAGGGPPSSPLPSIVIDMFALRGNSGGNNPRTFEKLLNLPGQVGERLLLLAQEVSASSYGKTSFLLDREVQRNFQRLALNLAEACQPRVFESS